MPLYRWKQEELWQSLLLYQIRNHNEGQMAFNILLLELTDLEIKTKLCHLGQRYSRKS